MNNFRDCVSTSRSTSSSALNSNRPELVATHNRQERRKNDLIAKRSQLTRIAIKAVEDDLAKTEQVSAEFGQRVEELLDKRERIVADFNNKIDILNSEKETLILVQEKLRNDLSDFGTLDVDVKGGRR